MDSGGILPPVNLALALPASARAPAVARQATRHALAGMPDDRVDVAVLLVSELVTNALLHTASAPTLKIGHDSGRLRFTVCDASPREPQPGNASEEDENARGLALVASLAATWGWTTTETGKDVWFELDTPRQGDP